MGRTAWLSHDLIINTVYKITTFFDNGALWWPRKSYSTLRSSRQGQYLGNDVNRNEQNNLILYFRPLRDIVKLTADCLNQIFLTLR